MEALRMKLLLLFTACVFVANGLCAQTKVIAHKSISGNNASFANLYIKGASELDESNFGEAPRIEIPRSVSRLDTVIFLSNSKSIMVTTCVGKNRYSPWWTPGSDTVFNHPLFGKKHSLDSIKQVLKSQYRFANDIDSVVFIGYDNRGYNHKHRKKQQKNAVPFIGTQQPPNLPPFMMLMTLMAISLAVGLGMNRKKPKQISFS